MSHSALGDVVISQSRRSKRVSISVRPPGAVRLSLPYNMPLSDAIKFLDSKVEWVEQAKIKMQKAAPSAQIEMPYSTRRHSLYLNPSPVSRVLIEIKDGKIFINYPQELNYLCERVQTAIKKGIEMAWTIEAGSLLPRRTEELAHTLGLKYNSITVRNTRSKWGSCSSRNDLSLSIHLMRLPDHLIDYIIVHELCHTVQKDHSPRFHALMEKLTEGQHKALNKEMKQYHTRW